MTNKTMNFSRKTITSIASYVYRLIDPRNGETFYVGKGQGNRVFQHVNNATSLKTKDEDEMSLKIQRINEIQSAGLDVLHVIHRHGMSDDVALEVEAALIDAYPGLTNVQGGHGSASRGPMATSQIEDLYNLKIATFDEDKFSAVIIKVKETEVLFRGNVYDAVRQAWVINEKKANKVGNVIGVVDGVIKGVWSNCKWSVCPTGRCLFEGVENHFFQKKYCNKRLPDKYSKKGLANPVLYSKAVRSK